MRAGITSTFRSLQVRNYRLFATGQLISLIFGWMQIIAQDWLVLQVSHNSGTALGAVTAMQFLPVLLLSLYAGKLADRFDKRRLLMLANLAWLVLASAMGLLVVGGVVRLWHVLVFAALWGIVSSMETPIRQAFASELVDQDMLSNALSLNSATFNSARIVGPAVAGVAIAILGTGDVFVVNAVSYIAPLVALAMMRPAELRRDTAPVPARSARVIDGLRYVRTRDDLVIPIVLVAIVGMLGFNFQLTLSLMAKKVFHTGAASFGLFSTALAVGALSGALTSTSRRKRPGPYLVTGAALTFGILETVISFAPTYWMLVAMLVPTGFAMIYFAQAANQRVQLGTAPGMRGRVMALYVMVFLGTTPIGAPLVGWSSQVFGPRSGLWLGGLVSLGTAAVMLMVQLRLNRARLRLRLRPVPAIYIAPSVSRAAPAPLDPPPAAHVPAGVRQATTAATIPPRHAPARGRVRAGRRTTPVRPAAAGAAAPAALPANPVDDTKLATQPC